MESLYSSKMDQIKYIKLRLKRFQNISFLILQYLGPRKGSTFDFASQIFRSKGNLKKSEETHNFMKVLNYPSRASYKMDLVH
jgi:hypothetical protein